MLNLKYRYVKMRMTAYLSGELPPRSRRRMARYIDESPRCYEEYRRQRQVADEMKIRLPSFGQPTTRQIEGLWTRIHAELSAPRARSSRRPGVWASYGLVLAALTIMLVLPLTLGSARALTTLTTSVAPTQPPPQIMVDQAFSTDAPLLVAAATQVVGLDRADPIVMVSARTQPPVGAWLAPEAANTPDPATSPSVE
jgi:anti-sigma factor RsiW